MIRNVKFLSGEVAEVDPNPRSDTLVLPQRMTLRRPGIMVVLRLCNLVLLKNFLVTVSAKTNTTLSVIQTRLASSNTMSFSSIFDHNGLFESSNT